METQPPRAAALGLILQILSMLLLLLAISGDASAAPWPLAIMF